MDNELGSAVQMMSVTLNGVQMAGRATKEFAIAIMRMTLFLGSAALKIGTQGEKIMGNVLGLTNTKGKTKIDNLKAKGGTLSMHTLDRETMEVFQSKAKKYGVLYSECSRFYENKGIGKIRKKSKNDVFYIAYPAEQQDVVNKIMDDIKKNKLKDVQKKAEKEAARSQRETSRDAFHNYQEAQKSTEQAKEKYQTLKREANKKKLEMKKAILKADNAKKSYEKIFEKAENVKESNPKEYARYKAEAEKAKDYYELMQSKADKIGEQYQQKQTLADKAKMDYFEKSQRCDELHDLYVEKLTTEKAIDAMDEAKCARNEANAAYEIYENAVIEADEAKVEYEEKDTIASEARKDYEKKQKTAEEAKKDYEEKQKTADEAKKYFEEIKREQMEGNTQDVLQSVADEAKADYEEKMEAASEAKKDYEEKQKSADAAKEIYEEKKIAAEEAKIEYEEKETIALEKEKLAEEYGKADIEKQSNKKPKSKNVKESVVKAVSDAEITFDSNNHSISEEEFIVDSGIAEISDQEFEGAMIETFGEHYEIAKSKFHTGKVSEELKKNETALNETIYVNARQQDMERRMALNGKIWERNLANVVEKDEKNRRIKVETPIQTEDGLRLFLWVDAKDVYKGRTTDKVIILLDKESELIMTVFDDKYRKIIKGDRFYEGLKEYEDMIKGGEKAKTSTKDFFHKSGKSAEGPKITLPDIRSKR